MDPNNQVIELSLKGIDMFAIVSSVVSVVLGIVAIALSILFYRMSVKSSREVESAAKDIGSNVKRLDIVFEKMYSDTFGMVKETVSDMRKHVYKPHSGKSEGEEALALEMERKTKEIVEKAINDIQDDKISKSDLEVLVKGIVQETTNVAKEYEAHSIINNILGLLKSHGTLTYPELANYLNIKNGDITLFDALEEMTEKEIIFSPFHRDDDEEKVIRHSTKIILKT